jgi:membrane carboxypeptidase/penicillin-binding protein PbpC
MLNRSAKTATYGEAMAKVEINLPDDLLDQVDRVAERVGETRDEFLARIAGQEVDRIDWQMRKELEQMVGPPQPMGGNAAEIIREMRDNWPPIRRGNVDDD